MYTGDGDCGASVNCSDMLQSAHTSALIPYVERCTIFWSAADDAHDRPLCQLGVAACVLYSRKMVDAKGLAVLKMGVVRFKRIRRSCANLRSAWTEMHQAGNAAHTGPAAVCQVAADPDVQRWGAGGWLADAGEAFPGRP